MLVWSAGSMGMEEKLQIVEPSEKMRPGRRRLLLIIVLAVFATIPFLKSDYLNYMGMRIAIMALFALSFNILLGYTGLLSFGHAAFYGVGGYTAGLMLIHLTSELPLAILAGAVSAGLTALLVGYFCVKRTRIYFSMLTLAFGMLIYVVCYKWKSLTGGTESLGGIPRGKVFGLIDMFPLGRYYFFVLTVTVLGIYLIYRITKSPFGLLIQGIRDNENRVRFAGVMVKRYRLYVFTIAGFFSGLAGGLYACLESTMFPSVCDWQSSAEPIMVTLVGGVESFLGPIVGSVVFILLKEIIVRFTQEWLLVFGVILLVILMGFRGGIAKFIERAFIERERSSGE
jgi:branched-chain amino acid transport system permease protein